MSDRTFVKSWLQRVRPDLNIKTGSPLEVLLVDPLVAILPELDAKLEEKYELSLDEKASLYMIERNDGNPAEFTVRLYFTSATDLQYGIGELTFYDQNGYLFTNKLAVEVTSANMSLYEEDGFYYTDLILTGDNVYDTTSSLEWENAPSGFSFLGLREVTTGGSLPETDEDLENRIAFQLSNRSLVTSPGAQAYYSDKYTSTIRDMLSIGFGEEEMNRDFNSDINAHVGGYVDIYMKEDLPVTSTYKGTIKQLSDRSYERTVSTIFEDGTGKLVYRNLLSSSEYTITAKSQTDGTLTYTEGVDYTIDRINGIVTHVSGGGIIADYGTPYISSYIIGSTTRDINISSLSDVRIGMYISLTDTTSGDTDWYLVINVYSPIIGVYTMTLDRDIPAGTYNVRRFDPIEFTFKYHPMGFELSDFNRPLMWIDNVAELDPLTEEPYDPIVNIYPKGGYGTGTYGGSGYGLGDEYGWKLNVDDQDYRYSIEETGVLEFVGDYEDVMVQITYRYSPNISQFQLDADSNRSQSANVLVKCFVPVNTSFTLDATASAGVEEITGLDEYIWSLGSRIELSDVIDELYSRGVSFVDIGDLIDSATFVRWNIDGTFSTLKATSQGVLELTTRTDRLLPGTMTINLS